MTAVVADTHTIMWYLREPNRLSLAAISALDGAVSSGYPVYVSSISIVEVVYLVERYRLPEAALGQLIDVLFDSGTGLEIASLNLAIAQAVSQIPPNTLCVIIEHI